MEKCPGFSSRLLIFINHYFSTLLISISWHYFQQGPAELYNRQWRRIAGGGGVFPTFSSSKHFFFLFTCKKVNKHIVGFKFFMILRSCLIFLLLVKIASPPHPFSKMRCFLIGVIKRTCSLPDSKGNGYRRCSEKSFSQLHEQHCHETQLEIRRQRGRPRDSWDMQQTLGIGGGLGILMQSYTQLGLKEPDRYLLNVAYVNKWYSVINICIHKNFLHR